MAIKPLLKPKNKKKKLKSFGTIKRSLDKLLQEVGRKIYTYCEICGGEYSCLHHYYPKSMSSSLRYHSPNLIPICAGCHFRHHKGAPEIHERINEIRGEDWRRELVNEKYKPYKDDRKEYEKIRQSFLLILEKNGN